MFIILISFKNIFASVDYIYKVYFFDYTTNNKMSRTTITYFPKISPLQNCQTDSAL